MITAQINGILPEPQIQGSTVCNSKIPNYFFSSLLQGNPRVDMHGKPLLSFKPIVLVYSMWVYAVIAPASMEIKTRSMHEAK